MLLATAAKRLGLILFLARLGIKSAYEYRSAFWLQIAGIFINNAALALMMWLLFKQFGDVHGWGFHNTLLVMGFINTSLGLVQLLFGNIHGAGLGQRIADGDLDSFMLFPQSTLFHISIRRIEIAGLGDIITGIIYFVLCGYITSIEAFVVLPFAVLLATAALFGASVLVQSLTFWLYGLRDFGQPFITMTMGSGQWPHNIYSSTAARAIETWLLPALVVVYMPAELISQFSVKGLLLLVLLVLGINIVALTVFKRGLKRYESGNLITTNI